MKKLGLLMVLLPALSLSSPQALACGGTFCDSGPQAMPVDQTGENVLFVLDGGYVEAQVQILYTGDAPRFAWIVPMPAIPEVSVGSQPLFSALLSGTVPTYNFTRQFESCGAADGGLNIGTGGTASFGSGGSGGKAAGGVSVISQEVVGAFEVTVLQSSSAQEISDWLATNGYQSVASAPELFADYVERGFVFAAIKLTGGTGIDEIHPLIFRYQGDEPCVPIKLTQVGAVENMGVRTFFLGDDRVYPLNYKHVELNPVRLDWSSRGSNYNVVVSRAVDSAVANGHAFVTEYAGPSAVVPSTSVFSALWDASVFVTLDPTLVLETLAQQGLGGCYFGQCQFTNPLVIPLLRQYLPAPATVPEATFYSDLTTYAELIDQNAWNGSAFAADLQTRIIEPGQHAAAMLDKFPYLTRLFTTISPAEMTEDPLFVARANLTLESVATFRSATSYVPCSGPDEVTLPDAREVLYDGILWPGFSSEMPWVERIEEVPASGDVIVLVDNTALIDAELAEWNAYMRELLPSSGGTTGSGGPTGSDQGGTTGNAPRDAYAPAGGCGCRFGRASHPSWLWLSAVGAAALVAAARRSARCAAR